jgi:hypothetical protein
MLGAGFRAQVEVGESDEAGEIGRKVEHFPLTLRLLGVAPGRLTICKNLADSCCRLMQPGYFIDPAISGSGSSRSVLPWLMGEPTSVRQ